MAAPKRLTAGIPPDCGQAALPEAMIPPASGRAPHPVPATGLDPAVAGTGTTRCADCAHLACEHDIETKRRRCSIMHGPKCVPCVCDGYREQEGAA